MGIKVSKVLFSGQDRRALSFNLASGALEGDAVAITANGTVGRGADNDPFYGLLEVVEGDNVGTVQRAGLMHLTYTGSMTVGPKTLVVDGAGKVKVKGSPAAGDRVWTVIAVQSGDTTCIVDGG